jgi:hypothetical protein
MSYTKLENQLKQIIEEGDFDDQFRAQIIPREYSIDIHVFMEGYDDDWRFTDVDIHCKAWFTQQTADDGQWLEFDGVSDIKVYADKNLIDCKAVNGAIWDKVEEFSTSLMN